MGRRCVGVGERVLEQQALAAVPRPLGDVEAVEDVEGDGEGLSGAARLAPGDGVVVGESSGALGEGLVEVRALEEWEDETHTVRDWSALEVGLGEPLALAPHCCCEAVAQRVEEVQGQEEAEAGSVAVTVREGVREALKEPVCGVLREGEKEAVVDPERVVDLLPVRLGVLVLDREGEAHAVVERE